MNNFFQSNNIKYQILEGRIIINHQPGPQEFNVLKKSVLLRPSLLSTSSRIRTDCTYLLVPTYISYCLYSSVRTLAEKNVLNFAVFWGVGVSNCDTTCVLAATPRFGFIQLRVLTTFQTLYGTYRAVQALYVLTVGTMYHASGLAQARTPAKGRRAVIFALPTTTPSQQERKRKSNLTGRD